MSSSDGRRRERKRGHRGLWPFIRFGLILLSILSVYDVGVSGAREKHLDPSVMASHLPRGALPTTSKMGIDATIPEGVDRSEYELLEYPFLDDVKLEEFL